MNRAATTALVAAMLLLAGQAGAAERWTNARWWTPSGFQAGERCVDEGRFVRRCPKNAPVKDFGGAWLIPALGEAHNHNLDVAADDVRAPADGHLAQGVLYVKIPNSRAETTSAARAALAVLDGVEATFSLGGLTGPKGHPERLYGFLSRFYGTPRSGASFEGDAFTTIRTAADAGPAIDRLKTGGADFVKLYLLNSEDWPARAAVARHDGSRGVDPTLAPAIVKAAHARGLTVAVHVETAFDFRTAVAAGVDEINHLPGYHWEAGATADRYRLTDADAEAAARGGVVVVTTAGISRNFAGPPERTAAVRALQIENLRRLRAAGVTLAIGSDDFQNGAAGEVAYLREIGVFNDTTLLRLWIDTPRASIFPDRKLGRLDPGYEANVTVLSADPSANLDATKAPRAVIKAGREVWRAP